MIKSIEVGFEVSQSDLESIFSRSDYKDLQKEIFDSYPDGYEILDSSFRIYDRVRSSYLIYYFLGESTDANTKQLTSVLNKFKIEVYEKIDQYLSRISIPHKSI